MSQGMVASGLEGIVVAETKMSDVDGTGGHLTLRGYDVEKLAGEIGFESAVGLFLQGSLPSKAEQEDLRERLAAGRVAAFELVPSLGRALELSDAMAALRASVAQLELKAAAGSREESEAVIAALPVFAAAWHRKQIGKAPVAPNAKLGHAADYLHMLTGEAPDAARAAALDTYLVTVSDHGMNASTFAARVVASTGSDLVSSIVAGICALKGPLHGGAPGPVLDMLDEIGRPEEAVAWIESELAAKRRIMGMGHRIYRVRDPRAAVLEKATSRLIKSGVETKRLELARAVEQAANGILQKKYPDRPLAANVEFYTAVLLDAVGLPRTLFSATFAVGRALGWSAHVAEQRENGRLIRPDSRYVGPAVKH